tara:strand:- start:1714 stop:2421 length:708 start_codon:yes stop_codon:yes gene_type:complete
MSPSELNELADDIRQNGLHKPIILYEDKILDGRNRFLACKKLWPEFTPDKKYEHYQGDGPLGYVLSLNLHRRHLTASQRAALAAEIANMTQGDGTHKSNLKQGRSAKISEATSQAEAAEKLDVSPAYIREAKKIQRESPEHFDQVKSGELSLQTAKRSLAQPAVDRPEARIVKSINKINLGFDHLNSQFNGLLRICTPDQISEALETHHSYHALDQIRTTMSWVDDKLNQIEGIT